MQRLRELLTQHDQLCAALEGPGRPRPDFPHMPWLPGMLAEFRRWVWGFLSQVWAMFTHHCPLAGATVLGTPTGTHPAMLVHARNPGHWRLRPCACMPGQTQTTLLCTPRRRRRAALEHEIARLELMAKKAEMAAEAARTLAAALGKMSVGARR